MASRELKIVLGILEEAAKNFRRLEEEADSALQGRDTKGYEAKLLERAQLIVDLPAKIAVPVSALKGDEEKIREQVKKKVLVFAEFAKTAIGTGLFSMGVLLTSSGEFEGSKNWLERLIDEIKNPPAGESRVTGLTGRMFQQFNLNRALLREAEEASAEEGVSSGEKWSVVRQTLLARGFHILCGMETIYSVPTSVMIGIFYPEDIFRMPIKELFYALVVPLELPFENGDFYMEEVDAGEKEKAEKSGPDPETTES